ncbi:MAG TPA: c-type cytochrome, methanol metabolism-related [Paracoccus sp. (in: a-proteobacteria)]|nr:c-type cytochrome, methanol metabolism-related [Paracoccus sp. (in: a-proteobacteria)]
MKTITTAAALLALSLATAATAQTAGAPAGTDAAGAGRAQTSTEMKVNAAGSAVATGLQVAPGQMIGTAAGKGTGAAGMDLTADHMENGRWYNAEGIPVFKIEDGVVDYATFSGYRRYHAECHVCHGPDGEGSTYAPALKDSVVNGMDYYTYMEIVASGKQNVNVAANLVMPAFGTNRNVWCYADDIYIYLLARGTGSIPRGRPAQKADKSPEFMAQEDSCMSG